MTLKELRTKGRDQARGNIAMLFVVELIWGAIMSVLMMPFYIVYTVLIILAMLAGGTGDVAAGAATPDVVTMLIFIVLSFACIVLVYVPVILVGGLIAYGATKNNSRMYKGEQATIEAGFISPIKDKKKISIKTYALQFLYLFLWGLIPVVGYVIMMVKSYSHACAFYIMEEDSNINGNAAITKSRELMNGYKMKMFLLDLSYIGWYILVFLTYGILGVWVVPWHNQARYNLYQQIKSQPLTLQ